MHMSVALLPLTVHTTPPCLVNSTHASQQQTRKFMHQEYSVNSEIKN